MTYRAEFDTIDAAQWHRLLQGFDDASIFQTWTYGAANWGEGNLSHAVIKKDGEVVGLAQTVLVGVPLLGKMLAYVMFGPVCQRHGSVPGGPHLMAATAALREEYVVRRRLCLRLRPVGVRSSRRLAPGDSPRGPLERSQITAQNLHSRPLPIGNPAARRHGQEMAGQSS
jgi:hypothetical protein